MDEAKSKDSGEVEEAKRRDDVSVDLGSNQAADDNQTASSNTCTFWDKEIYVVQVIPNVPAFVRGKYNSDDYDPLVVSFGPYHHGHPRLQLVQKHKPRIWKIFIRNTCIDEQVLLNEVMKVINDLRGSYVEGSTDMYDDSVFAQMMLQDAAFAVEHIIAHIMDLLDPTEFPTETRLDHYLGRGIVEHITRDLYVLENQIPFWFLKIMLHIRYGKDKGDRLLKNFLNWSSFRSIEVVDPWPDPAHLVEAVRTVVIAGWSSREFDQRAVIRKIRSHARVIRAAVLFKNAGEENLEVPQIPQVEGSSSISQRIHSFHSVIELKAKGIHIRRSRSNSLMDVSYSSGIFFSTLQLPAALATVRTRSVYSNIIAYEMSPQNNLEDYIVTAYVNFFKSLIESPKDVKELQDKGVIKNMLGSDEEVVNLYKNIYTFGIDCSTVYKGVIEEIHQHYNSKAMTWVADLLYSYFHSPWTALALLGSILVIFLTIAQTFYVVNPKGNN